MSNYTKTTNFTAKDALLTGDPNKLVKGSDMDTEFDAIASASATKANKISGGTANNVVEQDANGDLVDTGLATPTGAFVGISDTQTLTNKTLTTPVISSISNTGTVTLPTATTTLVGTDTTDTLTNKTIDGSQLVAGSVDQAAVGSAAIGRGELITSTSVSQAGTVNSEGAVLITLDPYSFFPMIHVTNSNEDIASGASRVVAITGHTTDGADPDAPRFRLANFTAGNETYDIDYRFITA